MEIKIDEFYTPNEIVRMGVIKGVNVDTRRQLLLRHIRNGDLEAKNLGTEAKPRYAIRGIHLREFINKQNNKK
jgi:hypothetical protein